METRASYMLVGAFVMTLIFGIFASIVWISRYSDREAQTFYYIYFRGSVSGLSVGAPVRLRGVPVGTVRDIAIDDQNVELIQVTIALREGTPIKEDTYATLALAGITGGSYILLAGGSQNSPALLPRPGRRRAVIQARASAIEQAIDEVPQLLSQVRGVVGRIEVMLGPETTQAFANIVANIDRITSAWSNQRAALERVIAEAPGTVEDARRVLRDAGDTLIEIRGFLVMAQNSGGVVANAEAAFAAFQGAARSIDRLGQQLDQLVGENRRSIRDFANVSLGDLSRLVVEFRSLISGLQRLFGQVERDPTRFFFGDPQRGFEAR